MDMNAEALEVKKKWQETTDLIDEEDYRSIWEYVIRKFSQPAYDHVKEDFRDQYVAIMFDEEIGNALVRSYINARTAIIMREKEDEGIVRDLFADAMPSAMPERAGA